MIGKKPIGLGLLVALAAVLAMALMAPLASATQITPANEAFTASLKAETTANFDPENAYSTSTIRCKASGTNGTTPTAIAPTAGTNNNTNRLAIGVESAGPGGVGTDLTNPTFTTCALYVSGKEQAKPTVSVATNSTNGMWTLSGDAISESVIEATIGVPKNAAVISLEGGACKLIVSSERATAVMGRWTNGTSSTVPSTLKVDSQIRFADEPAGCSGFKSANPAQFEALYQVKATGVPANVIKILP